MAPKRYGPVAPVEGEEAAKKKARKVRPSFVVTKRVLPKKQSNRKGKLNPRIKMIREVVREVSGFAPYERRVMELIKIGSASTLKRALKLSKRRLGTHLRGKRKREEMVQVIAQQRRRQAAAAH